MHTKHTKYKVNYKVKYPNLTAKMWDMARWIHICAFEYGFVLQCNLDLVTLLVSAKTVTKSHYVTKLIFSM